MSSDGAAEPSSADDLRDASALLRRRFEEYLLQWERAAEKLRRSEYRSDDLLDDWFTFIGNAARDATAITTLMWRAAGSPAWRPSTRREP